MSYDAIFERHLRVLLNAGEIDQREYERRLTDVEA